jgi:hypothetical protein
MPAKGYLNSRDIMPRAIQPYHEGLRVENAFAGTLTAGTLVYVSGVNTTSTDLNILGMPQVTKADADAAAPANVATYVVTESIPQSGYGIVARAFTQINVDTSAYTAVGDPVFLSATAGNTFPSDPSVTSSLATGQRVGYVKVKSATVGEIVYDLLSNGITRVGTRSLPPTGVLTATGSLTNAQILALVGTPVTLVPAPGAGLILEFISGALFFDYTAAYVEPSAPDDLVVRYTGASGTITSQDVDSTNFLTASADAMAFIAPLAGAITTVRLKTAVDNQPLVLHNTGTDLTGGNAGNVVRYSISYRIVAPGW